MVLLYMRLSTIKTRSFFGYIDGLSKLVAIAVSWIFSYFKVYENNLASCTFTVTILLMVFTYILGYTRSLLVSYFIYILGSVTSFLSLIMSHNGFNHMKDELHVILGVNLCISSLIHICISYISKWRNCNADRKLMYYFWVNSVLLLACFCIAYNVYA
jgi:hypothetical protein